MIKAEMEENGGATKVLCAFRDSGISFLSDEGAWYLIQNYDYFSQMLRNYTGDFRDYIVFCACEQKERIAHDAGLLIGWDHLRRRIVRWEIFARQHPELKETGTHILPRLETLIHFYLFGIDNTPAYDIFRKTGKLDPDLQQSYEAFLKENTRSAYMPLIREAYRILGAHDFRINALLLKFLKSEGYQSGLYDQRHSVPVKSDK